MGKGEDGMRPSRRWWVFILVSIPAWAGWWVAHRHRPPSGDGEANGGGITAPGLVDEDWRTRRDQGGPVAQTPTAVVADDAPPLAPPGPSDEPTAPGPFPGLEDLSAQAGPPPGGSAGLDRLPTVDTLVAPAAAEIEAGLPAEVRRAVQAQQEGRLADAERHLLAAIKDPAANPAEARRRLAEVYWLEGRFDEVRALAEDLWRRYEREGAHRDAQELLQFHMTLALNPLPVDRIRSALDRAIAQAPQDDRVWLARAYLALRDGRLVEARSWLDACRRRRADDPVVWKARLEWAIAADRPDEAAAALPFVGADDLSPARVHELRAWFASHRGDLAAERRALEQAVAADPGCLTALERLAELAVREARSDDAARLRRRKAELDEAMHRYRTLFREDDPIGSTAKLARLAESLGRRFEAVGLWSIVRDASPADTDARAALERLAQAASEGPPSSASRSLADVCAEEISRLAASTRPAAPAAQARRTVPLFRDDAKSAGLNFAFVNGQSERRQLPEASSGGAALLDYDGDGRLDVYFVQGGTFPPSPDPAARAKMGDRLFRNRGDGTFEDVTGRAGLAAFPGGYGHGVSVGDYDNDGRPDLFVTRWRSYALYHNRGDGTFEDATAAMGLAGDRDWPTSSAFADLDGDGDLDLYVCHYLAWDAANPEVCRSPSSGRVNPCDPLRFTARPDHLFRNDGTRFVDVTNEAGIVDRDGRGLGVVAADVDDDGKVDLFVANDGTANFLFLNRGGLKFEEAGHESGVAAAGGGGYRAGMGIARGDLDGDGRPDLAVTNFFGESTTFYQNLGGGLFTDRTAAVGLDAPSRYRLGFGVSFLDADDDGRLDLLTVNGHIADSRPEIPYAMPAQLMLGGAGGRLVDVSTAAGAPFQVPRLGRGLAVGDLDDDGRLDAIVVSHEGPAAYFHNTGPGGHSIAIRLEGTRSNRDAVGTRVTIQAGGRSQLGERFGGGSYQSAGDPRLHFGLGDATRVDAIEVRWPSGLVQKFGPLPADAGYVIREGDRVPRAVPRPARRDQGRPGPR